MLTNVQDGTCTVQYRTDLTMQRTAALLFLHALGIYLFAKGFFLTRLELGLASTSGDLSGTILSPDLDDRGSASLSWSPARIPRYRRLVFVVIDAWRLDFALERMPGLSNLLEERPDKTRLYRAIADVPTVTMQRLKGMTAGSLPTFLDASANFASGAISEDNLVDQAAAAAGSEKRRRRDQGNSGHDSIPLCPLIFAGDDTWASLFPQQFDASHPLPSFDVADLHSVDRGVAAHLIPTVDAAARAWARRARGLRDDAASPPAARLPNATSMTGCPGMADADFRLLVAHFLGVDHVGHRHGPSHRAMAEKLAEMDAAVLSLVHAVDALDAAEEAAAEGDAIVEPRGTVVVVLGDHGMTEGGNHGGGSDGEVAAALLVYSPQAAFLPDDLAAATAPITPIESAVRTVSQVDIVPSLALLLGWPIPHASVGAPLPDIRYEPAAAAVSDEFDSLRTAIASAHAHGAAAFQLQRYLKAYHSASAAFPASLLADLDARFRRAKALHVAALESIEANLCRVKAPASSFDGPMSSYRRLLRGLRSDRPSVVGLSRRVEAFVRNMSCDALNASARLGGVDDMAKVIVAYRAFLDAGSHLCRSMWTQFDLRAMIWGLAVLALALGSTLASSMSSSMEPRAAAVVLVSTPPSHSDAAQVSACVVEHQAQPQTVLGVFHGVLLATAVASMVQPCEVLRFVVPGILHVTRHFHGTLCHSYRRGLCTELWYALVRLESRSEEWLAWVGPGGSLSVPIPAVVAAGISIGLFCPHLMGRIVNIGLCRKVSEVAPALAADRRDFPAAPSFSAALLRLVPAIDLISCDISRFDPWSLPVLVFIVLRLWALFSNSFIVAEARVIGYLLQSATVTIALGMCAALRNLRARDVATHKATRAFWLGSIGAILSLCCGRACEAGLSDGLNSGDSVNVHAFDQQPDLLHSTLPLFVLPTVIVVALLVLNPVFFASIESPASGPSSPRTLFAAASAHDVWLQRQVVATFAVSQASAVLTFLYWNAASRGEHIHPETGLSLRLWGPRAVYLASLACLGASVVGVAVEAIVRRPLERQPTRRRHIETLLSVLLSQFVKLPHRPVGASTLGLQPLVPLAVSLRAAQVLLSALGPVLLVLGPHSPAAVLLLIIHTISIVALTVAAMALFVAVTTAKVESDSIAVRGVAVVLRADASVSCYYLETRGSGGATGFRGALARVIDLICRGPVLTALFAWSLLAPHWFLASGHGFSFSKLNYAAAFIGFDEFHHLVSGTLLFVNTYAAQLLVSFVAPVFVRSATFNRSVARARQLSQNSVISQAYKLGTLWEEIAAEQLAADSARDTRDVFNSGAARCLPFSDLDHGHLRMLLLALPSAVCLATSTFCCIARRHLMVWAIFAPKFVFDAAALVVSLLVALFC